MYLELQPHAIDIQGDANQLIMKLFERYGGEAPLLATQDAHYVNQSDHVHHDCLLCIGTGANVMDADRFRFDGDEFHFKGRKEMLKSFRRNHSLPDSAVKAALDNTVEFSERCNAVVEVDYKKALLPDPGIPKKYGGDAFLYMKDLCLDGWEWRQIKKRAKRRAHALGLSMRASVDIYRQRLLSELRTLKSLKFHPYFLVVHDIYREARERRIMTGPGRGSAGGSLVAFLLGITSVDPIEHDLLFERFINPGRKDYPDVDMDFQDDRRDELIEYMVGKYGREKVAQIATIGKLKGKQVFRDVSRILKVPLFEVDKVAPSILEKPKHAPDEFDCIPQSFQLEALKEFDRKYPKVQPVATALEGRAKTLGIHAAGVVVSPVDLRDITPLEVRTSKDKKIIVTALDMEKVAAVGLVKYDFLALKTLTVVRHGLDQVERRKGVSIDMESIDFDLEDEETLQAFTDQDFVGVFQFDSASARSACKGVAFERFADIATMTALNRPGPAEAGALSAFKERKADRRKIRDEYHPVVSEITEDTLGVLCYQEHITKIFQRCGGMSLAEADNVRKAIGKKLAKSEIEKYRSRFVDESLKIGMDEETSNRLMTAMIFFSGYAFNKAHATEYAMIAYWCQWLKVKYPLEFFYGLMRAEKEQAKIQSVAAEAKRKGISVLPPHVNISNDQFVIDDKKNAIRGSLTGIKGVGAGAAKTIEENQPFSDFVDFCQRVNRRACHKGVVAALAKAGAFGGMVSTRWAIEGLGEFWKELGKKVPNEEKLRALMQEGEDGEDYDNEEAALLATEANPLAFGTHPLDAWSPFLDRVVKVRVRDMDPEDFISKYDGKGIYVVGSISGVRRHQIGDHHDGPPPSEIEKKRRFWGRAYANVNIEDRTGTDRRIKFGHHMYERFREVVDQGTGSAILVHVTPSSFGGNMRANFAIDLRSLRKRLKEEDPELSLWEEIVMGDHPATLKSWKTDKVRRDRESNESFRRGGRSFCGVVTHTEPRYDKAGGLMATFGLLDAAGHFIKVVAFSSLWREARRLLRPGSLVRVELKRQKRHGRTEFLLGEELVTY